ncbi:MAG: pyrroloquinoline quinone precursor peptide PqqA [Cocleimonas sp.]|nr:pyrroloquinoline quinone precursor peptide PqqA [Cocleimonas sp.]
MFISYFLQFFNTNQMETFTMKWEKPTYQDYRFGFEVTMYIMNR